MDWGFNEFIKLDNLKSPDNGFIYDVDGVPCVLMEVTVKDNSMEVFNPPYVLVPPFERHPPVCIGEEFVQTWLL